MGIFIKGYASYSFTPDLTFTTNGSVDQVFTWAGSYSDNRSATYTNALNTASISNGRIARLSWNNVLSYKKTFGVHAIDATGVFEIQNDQTFNSGLSGQNLSLTQYKWFNMGSALENQVISSGFSRRQLASYVGRVQYGFKERYMVSASIRSDGASQLAPDDRWDYFPAVAGAWRISEEAFMKNIKQVSDLKLRISYGLTGNNAISPYATQGAVLTRYTIFAGTNGDVPYTTNEPDQQPVLSLKWEKTRMLNIGLDFGLFNDRLTGSLNYYDSQTSDLLNQRKLPYTAGFNFVWDNIGRTSNKGFEIGLNALAVNNKDFKWNVGLTFYRNKEKLVELYDPRLSQDIANNWFLGYPVSGVTYEYDALGIWQTNEASTAAIYGRTPGEVKIKDLNGDGKIDGNDREIIGTERPNIQSSLITSATWKQFDIALDFYSEVGAIAFDSWSGSTYGGSIGRYNIPVIDYWTPGNPTNHTPQPRVGTAPSYLSATGYHTNNYIRLRNATVGYTFSKSVVPGVKKLRLYAASTNPWQYWSFLHEGGISSRSVIYNLGLNVTF